MDENGLDLSLGLSFGGSSSNPKGKGSSSDFRVEEDRGNKTVGEFKGFISVVKNNLESMPVPQADVVKVQENFCSDLSKANTRTDEREVGIEGITNKRKMLFDEISHRKRHPREPKCSDAQEKSKTLHISINTKDCSIADNEDVVEPEADGSTSRLVLYHNTKDVLEYKVGNLTYGIPFSVHPINVVNGSQGVPLRDSSSVTAPGTPIYTPSVTRHPMSVSVSERQVGIKAMTSGNMPVILGYSPVPLPTMDKDNSWMLAPHTAYPGKSPRALAPSPANPNSSREVAQNGQSRSMVEITKDDGKQHGPEEGLSTPAEEDARTVTDNLFAKFAVIKPGIAADLKFGGCGSVPNLPWVSTTRPGPNGRTLSGVTYRYSVNQIRIVCACHGSHLSPEEFVRHASKDNANDDSGLAFPAIQNNNPAPSAQS